MRICSLLPSATEIVYALGLGQSLVGKTHECDYPPEAANVPSVTESVIDSTNLSSREIDDAIREALRNLSTIYTLDRSKLSQLQPDLILTQELCEVCAVSFARVQEAASSICPNAQIISLEPQTLEGILDSLFVVAAAADAHEDGLALIENLRRRLAGVREVVNGAARVRVAALEWLDPLFTAGHWVPEMIDAAGGEDVFCAPGERSRTITWTELAAADPDIVIAMPCGFDLPHTIQNLEAVDFPSEWVEMRAVRDGRVYAVDASAYFNRPGPRIVTGVEILATILQPESAGQADQTMVRRFAR